MEAHLGRWLFSDQDFVHSEAEVSILPNVVAAGGMVFVPEGDWKPLRSHLKSLPVAGSEVGDAKGACCGREPRLY